jgi:hypothetical protein
VLVGAGEYFGLLRPVHSGLPDAPIVFAATPGERVELSGRRLTHPTSVLILDKRHIVLRGFVFKEHCKMLQDDVGLGAQILIGDSRDIRVEGCLFDGRMYYMTSAFVFRSGEVRFEDNVFYTTSNYTGILLGMNTGTVTFDHNTFFAAGTTHGQVVANQEVVFTNNIFGEKLQVKWGQPDLDFSGNARLVLDRNYYAFNDANTARFALQLRTAADQPLIESRGADTLAAARKLGLELAGRAGPEPWAKAEEIAKKSTKVRGVAPAAQDMKPLERGDFALRSDAPCRGMAEGGADPGARLDADVAAPRP